jgi:hypothetical protein
LFAVALLIVSSILSAYASAEAEKKNTATAQKWSMWSAILSGLGVVIIIISSVVLALSWATREKGKEIKLGNLVEGFVDNVIQESDLNASVPISNLFALKNATKCYAPSQETSCPTTIPYKTAKAPAAQARPMMMGPPQPPAPQVPPIVRQQQ